MTIGSRSFALGLWAVVSSSAFAQDAQALRGEAPATRAADAAKAVEEPDPGWTLRFEPAVWYAGISGNLRMPGAPAGAGRTTIRALNGDSPRMSPFAEVHARLGDWRLSVSGAFFSTDRDSIAASASQVGPIVVAPGDVLATSLDFTTFEVLGGYSLGRWSLVPRTEGGFGWEPEILLVGGVRYFGVDFEVQGPGGVTASADEAFVQPAIGFRAEMELVEAFSIDVQTLVGYWPDEESTSVDIVVGFVWKPIDGLGVQVGYRHAWLDLTSGEGANEFHFDGATAGLYAGIELKY
ncbi:MAG: hypothetical protein HRU70_12525 [Phycisphaeraceae bacterium]|nr:MAG: hypothetical protein HRU70_12525 [Phycisphaeraceae bacterium]